MEVSKRWRKLHRGVSDSFGEKTEDYQIGGGNLTREYRIGGEI